MGRSTSFEAAGRTGFGAAFAGTSVTPATGILPPLVAPAYQQQQQQQARGGAGGGRQGSGFYGAASSGGDEDRSDAGTTVLSMRSSAAAPSESRGVAVTAAMQQQRYMMMTASASSTSAAAGSGGGSVGGRDTCLGSPAGSRSVGAGGKVMLPAIPPGAPTVNRWVAASPSPSAPVGVTTLGGASPSTPPFSSFNLDLSGSSGGGLAQGGGKRLQPLFSSPQR